MAISFVGSNSENSSGANFDVSLPAGVQTGDLVIAATAGASIGEPDWLGINTANYTNITELFANDNADSSLYVYYKFMGATPDEKVNFSGPDASGYNAQGIVYVLRGVDTSTPLDVSVTTATGTNGSIPNPPSITPTTTGAFIVVVGASSNYADSGGDADVTPPTDYTNQRTQASPNVTNDGNMSMASWGGWSSGAHDPAAWTDWVTDIYSAWCAATIALRPASGATAKTLTFDGKIRIRSATTGLMDGKSVLKSAATGLLDGKAVIGSAAATLMDGVAVVVSEAAATGNLDGLAVLKSAAAGPLDGQVVIGSAAAGFLDGRALIGNIGAGLLDGAVVIRAAAANLLDGRVVAGSVADGLLDGAALVVATTTGALDGAIVLGSDGDALLDGALAVRVGADELMDGVVLVVGTGSALLDGQVVLASAAAATLDGALGLAGHDAALLDGALFVSDGWWAAPLNGRALVINAIQRFGRATFYPRWPGLAFAAKAPAFVLIAKKPTVTIQ